MKQIKDMTTAEWRKAWTEIAIAFETEYTQRSPHQQRITRCGLCFAFYTAHKGDDICRELGQFSANISTNFWFPRRYYDWGSYSVLYPYHKSTHDLLRSTFAAMFAAMTPKEFLAICEAPRD